MNLQKLLEALGPTSIALAVVFVVPSYVALEAYSSVVPAERRNFGEEVLRVVAVSLLNFLLFFVLIPIGPQEIPESLADVGLLDAGRLLVSRFVVQPEPTAWNYYFREDREVLVVFYLREEAGSGILGEYFGSESRASPYPGVQQVYIEGLWDLGEDGSFLSPREQSGGATISYNNCAFVEFFELTEEDRERRSS